MEFVEFWWNLMESNIQQMELMDLKEDWVSELAPLIIDWVKWNQ